MWVSENLGVPLMDHPENSHNRKVQAPPALRERKTHITMKNHNVS